MSCSTEYPFPPKVAIVGIGVTGLSLLRFLLSKGVVPIIFEQRIDHPNMDTVRALCPDIAVITGVVSARQVALIDLLIVSPGVCTKQAPWSNMDASKIISDVVLFRHYAKKPIVAVTGSNGKSTVVSLLAHCLQSFGQVVGLGGNIGTPVLDLLAIDDVDIYVLELSSFQLALTPELKAYVAVFLNISPDHVDWHGDFSEYVRCKHQVYVGCGHAIYARADRHTHPLLRETLPCITFDASPPPTELDFGIQVDAGVAWICQGTKRIAPVNDLPAIGSAHTENYLAVFAVLQTLGYACGDMVQACVGFKSLAHRCEFLGTFRGRAVYNDSKATNSAAMFAALQRVCLPGKASIVLVAGGIFKEETVPMLPDHLVARIKIVLLFGQDAQRLAAVWKAQCRYILVSTIEVAIQEAFRISRVGDCILLSPACASHDQFSSYIERGKVFSEYVMANFHETADE